MKRFLRLISYCFTALLLTAGSCQVGESGSLVPIDDMDGDGIDDADDPDVDGDGIPNESDAGEPDPDIDGDGILNPQDDDMDGDGIKNDADASPQIPDEGAEPPEELDDGSADDAPDDGTIDDDDELDEPEPLTVDLEESPDGDPPFDGTVRLDIAPDDGAVVHIDGASADQYADGWIGVVADLELDDGTAFVLECGVRTGADESDCSVFTFPNYEPCGEPLTTPTEAYDDDFVGLKLPINKRLSERWTFGGAIPGCDFTENFAIDNVRVEAIDYATGDRTVGRFPLNLATD